MTRFNRSAAQRADKPEEPQRLASWYTPGFSDGIGDRLLMFDNTTASSLELLRFRPEFGTAPGFAEALRARVEALVDFTHPAVARVRAVESLGENDGLALISNHIVGRRLSEILQDARGPQFATELVRQLVPVLAALQEQGTDVAHGLITPDRVVVTPEGRLVLVEHVLGSAFDALGLPASRLQAELGLSVPPGARVASLDQRADIVQLGYLALSLLMGERIHSVDSAGEVFGLLDRHATANRATAPPYLQQWLLRALQVDGRSFTSAGEAAAALADWPDLELDGDRAVRRLRTPAVSSPKDHLPSRSAPAMPRTEAPRPVPAAAKPVGRPVSTDDDAEVQRRPDPRPEPAPARATIAVPEPAPAEAPAPRPTPIALPEPAPVLAVDLNVPLSSASTFMDSRTARLAIAGLVLVAIVEALVIAGLLNTRRSEDGSATVTAAAPADAPAAELAVTGTSSASSLPVGTSTGRLEVTSEPSGARVIVGGRTIGTTPITTSLPPGEHTVVIAAGADATRRTVNITPGGTATLVASMAPAVPAGAAGGWLSIDTPLDLQVFAGSTLVGTTRADRIMLPAGRHNLRLSSPALAYETALTVDVQAGKTVAASLAPPNGSLSLNAVPWAHVSLDGRAVGATPIANLAVPIGTHEVVWHHPDLGERRQTIVVTARTPVRLVIDLRQ